MIFVPGLVEFSSLVWWCLVPGFGVASLLIKPCFGACFGAALKNQIQSISNPNPTQTYNSSLGLSLDGCANILEGCASMLEGCANILEGCASMLEGCASMLEGCHRAIRMV